MANIDLAAVRAEIATLLATDIFSSHETTGPLFKAAYVWLILNLHELLQAADTVGERIVLPDVADDVTDLIQRARYAIVHRAGGAKRGRPDSSGAYRLFVGAASGFDDDIAVELGGVRVLIRRHAVRAYLAVCALAE